MQRRIQSLEGVAETITEKSRKEKRRWALIEILSLLSKKPLVI